MEIKGVVTSGYGRGAYFLAQEFYKSKFNQYCGFTPFPGTLNISVSEEFLEDIKKLKHNCKNVIKSKKGFGGVKYIKATLNNDISGAIVFPDKTSHEENYLEFIAKDNLRKKLNLEDGDFTIIKINID
ncbi:MAG: DUF120 domain-containing protein [Methanobacteriaceae archaeon]|jgi:riboflavin kinase|nr:DUF120 domain-containing protein [Candidatus Methanorudis spinitermitis]